MSNKIYITSLHMMHGGMEMAITLLANALVKKEYEVEILSTYNLGEPVYELDERVKITYLTEVRPNKKEIKEALRSLNPIAMVREALYAMKVLYLKKKTMKDCLSAISEGVIIATRNDHAVLLSKYGQKNVKKIAQLHHDHQFKKKLMHDFERNYANIDVFVLLNEWLKEEVQEMMKENHHTKLVVIPNFLPIRGVYNEGKRDNQVIAVGRMHEVKAFPRMLEIWKETKLTETYVLKIIGAGDEFEKVSKKVDELGLADRVILTGAMEHEQVMKEMCKSKAYLMTSLSEVFPFVLIEAMSAGLPIVAYDVRVGPRVMIQDGVNGYLIEDGDANMFADRLAHILNQEQVFQEMSKASFEKTKQYTEEVVIKDWIRILES
ncbi:MAG: glycosyltransferase [Agathobacter sp.]|nr:glycosyltransferase [Agathobacter sp.]